METLIKVYDREQYNKLLPGIKVLQTDKFNNVNVEIETQIPTQEDLNISQVLCCSFCKITFEDIPQQRQHYKTDWHRYNLKQNLKTLDPISEEIFDQIADEDNVSSISGSDSESDDNSEGNTYAVNQGKIFFRNDDGKVFSMYRSLLHEKKNPPSCDDALLKITRQCAKNTYWTILMLGGGHFAGAIYNGSEVLVHKTFHCYTVRAKQGGSQGARDNKAGGAHPKSAGASLRRYNEMALVQHVGDILQVWAPHIDESNLIFYRATGPYNRSVLFSGKNPVLKKTDIRLRTIPFATRRPTYTELQRVQVELSNIEIYSSIESVKSIFSTSKPTEDNSPTRNRRESPKNKNINRAKSRETKERPLPGAEDPICSDESDTECIFDVQDEEISFQDLREYADTVPESVKKRKQDRKKKPKRKDPNKKLEANTKRELYNACSNGKLEALKLMVEKCIEHANVSEDKADNYSKFINMVVDEHGNTPLHIAASNSHMEMIVWLMEHDATPCSKNDKFQTPYTINADKTIRNVFRTFATDNPDKYNYAKASIPIIVQTFTEEELAEKRRAQRKNKKEKEKEKRKESEIKRKDEEEMDRFLKLSDREKRALAAERRILAQTSTVLVRCFLCGVDISGKVPFEYSGNRFCSMPCLKAHRIQNPPVFS